MSKRNHNDDWDGESIVIESQEHYDELLKNGYEVTGRKMSFERIGESSNEMKSKFLLQMMKNGKRYIANADAISGLVLGLDYLYDFQKKKPVFMPTPGGAVSSDLEWAMMDIITGKYTKPLMETKVNTTNPSGVYFPINHWIENEKKKLRSGLQSDLFHLAFIVNEKSDIISAKTLNKTQASLDDFALVYKDSVNYDNSIILSFFYLTKKQSEIKDSDDVLFGMILYDLKAKQVLCFNIQSSARFLTEKVRESELGTFNIAMDVFYSSIDNQMTCKSFIPMPVDSPYYTAMPWFSYAVLHGMEMDDVDKIPIKRKLSIAEFFVFGSPPFVRDSSSFYFRPFSSKRNGVAICMMNFKEDGADLTYNLRFDQSKGQPLVHVDYSFMDGREVKLIAHRPLVVEEVQQFNQDLFVAMMCAGLCDSYFTTIIEGGLAGIHELIKKHPAFAYPLKWIWVVDTAIIWLNKNKEGYRILEKLSNNKKLDSNEMEFMNKMIENNIDLISEDKDCNIIGINYIGYMVLQRYKRGMIDITMASGAE